MLQVQQVTEQEHTDRLLTGALAAAGADIEIPDAGSYRREFDALLVAPLIAQTPREVALRRLRG